MRFWPVATMLALAWVGPALSTPAPWAAAEKAMAEGEFKTALKRLDAALPRTKEPAMRARLQLLRGQALAALDLKDRAVDAFAAALALDAAAELDSATASPTVLDLFEKARSRVSGTLAVGTSVKGAQVRIDDTAHGPAPLTVELPVGRHRVEASSEGFRGASAEVLVRKGERETVELQLEPLPPPSPAATTTEPVAPAPLGQAAATPGAESKPTLTDAPRTRSSLPWVTLGVGAAASAAGAFFMLQAGDRHRELINPNGPALSTERERQLVQEGSAFQTYGLVGLGLGAAVATTGLSWLLLRGEDEDEFSWVTPTTNGLSWGGVW